MGGKAPRANGGGILRTALTDTAGKKRHMLGDRRGDGSYAGDVLLERIIR